jgi:peptidoglycan/xylan/chitin deacetylase (PgdA/CDA1 family)
MVFLNCFPGGVQNCLTFSFDDGAKEDIRLSKLFKKYGMKCTFNLSDCMIRVGEEDFEETYSGHEIACHGKNHIKIDIASDLSIMDEMLTNRKTLEAKAGYTVCGHAYAGGYHDDRSIEVLKKCGIVYGRTTRGTNFFDIPKDFMHWHPTCHQKNAAELCEKFLKYLDDGHPRLLYIWGHSFEFRTEEDWETFEKAIELVANNEKIWYATNMEVYDYLQAVNNLRFSADETYIYNPSAIDVWVSVDKQPIKIPAGKQVKTI